MRWSISCLVDFFATQILVCAFTLGSRCRLTVTLVVGLLVDGCPATVARFVVAVVVDAIKGSVFWTFPHIGKEGFEGVEPSGMHRDAATLVVLGAGVVGIGDAIFCHPPGAVGGGVGETVCALTVSDGFKGEATAGACSAVA